LITNNNKEKRWIPSIRKTYKKLYCTLARLDWDKLDKLIYDPNEARGSALIERRYNEMVSTYEDFKRKYHG
jgi:hypothetical protein